MSTFGSFGTVRLGLYASQKGLDVTGNNITNINTEGYTRQRLNQVSLIPSASDRYYSSYKTRIGQGAVINGVTQLRDPGLDISYRKAQADLGSANAKMEGLNDLAAILDEVGKGSLEQDDGVILSQLNDLRDLISKAVTSGVDDYDRLIYASASALTTMFNSYANSLSNLKDTYETELDQQVDEVNNILSNIQKLNVSIRNADIRGDEALELRDERNRQLDKLSQYMKIDVTYSMEDVGADTYVEKLTIKLAGTPPHDHTLVDGQYAGTLGVDKENNYRLTLSALEDANGNTTGTDVVMLDTEPYGSIQSIRELLTEKGEYSTSDDADPALGGDPNAASKRGIPYYQKALDNLAYEFAEQMNKLNNTGLDKAGNLFSNGNGNDDTGITAANITVSQGWSEQTISIQATADPNAASGDTSQLAKFLALFNKDLDFTPGDVADDAVGAAYTGTFEDMLLKIQSTLAEDQMTTDAVLNNYAVTADELYVDREGVMGVDLNDEATNLMTYQKAYTAACRLMTVLEEALDSLINGTV
jgi:flagellar hook-associated protein 1 FlgK